MKHPMKFPFWIIYLRFPTRAIGTSTLWQPHHVFLEILQRAFQLLCFPPGPLPGKQVTKLSCKRLGNRGASIKCHFPYLADSDLTEGLFLHPSCKGVSFSFKAIAQQPKSLSIIFLLSTSHNREGIWLFFSPVLDSSHLSSGLFSGDISTDTFFPGAVPCHYPQQNRKANTCIQWVWEGGVLRSPSRHKHRTPLSNSLWSSAPPGRSRYYRQSWARGMERNGGFPKLNEQGLWGEWKHARLIRQAVWFWALPGLLPGAHRSQLW